MRIRWLFGNFAEPHHRLTLREQHAISKRAHDRHMPVVRWIFCTLFAIVVPLFVVLRFVLPVALEHLGLAGRSGAYTIGLFVVVLLSWPLSAWVYGHIYVKSVRKAMRDAEHDVCVHCGYMLDGLSDVRRCPECGRKAEPPAPVARYRGDGMF